MCYYSLSTFGPFLTLAGYLTATATPWYILTNRKGKPRKATRPALVNNWKLGICTRSAPLRETRHARRPGHNQTPASPTWQRYTLSAQLSLYWQQATGTR